MGAVRKVGDRAADIRKIWGLAGKAGVKDYVRDIAGEVCGIASISALDAPQRRSLILHLSSRMGGHAPPQRAKWLASAGQVALIRKLHYLLKEAGELDNPPGFMKSQTGRERPENLPTRSGKSKVGASGYIDLLKMKCKRAGLPVY